jgi:hypothetical protein
MQTNTDGKRLLYPYSPTPSVPISSAFSLRPCPYLGERAATFSPAQSCPPHRPPRPGEQQHASTVGQPGLRRQWSSRSRGRLRRRVDLGDCSSGVQISVTACPRRVLAHPRPRQRPHLGLGCHSACLPASPSTP